MHRKLLLKVFIILFCIAFHDLNTRAGMFQPKPGSKVPADNIIAAIEQGEDIIIDSCEIFGPLKIEGFWGKFDTIGSFINITNSTFWSSISFKYCYLMKEVNFKHDNFNGQVHFLHCAFTDDANFWYTTFGGDADFGWTYFDRNAYFRSTTFSGSATFFWTVFGGFADFFQATFTGYGNFSFARFGGNGYFWLSIFKEGANFWSTIFEGNANFDSTTFGEEANFLHTSFDRVVNLDGIKFKNIYISWSQLEGHLICDILTSYKLKEYFEERRQLDDADGVYLFLKKKETSSIKWYNPSKYFNYLIWLTCGYGVKPFYTLLWCIGIIFLFARFFAEPNAILENKKEFWVRRQRRLFQRVTGSWRKRFYYALYFSVHTFIVGVVSDWHATDEFLIKFWKIKRLRFRTLSMIEGILGWILLVLFVVTLTRKFIR